MSSVDFRAFVQAEVEEKLRLADVYQGAQDEGHHAVEHVTIDHLSKLLSENLSPEIRSLYLREYDEIRSHLRALAVCGMTKKDYYDEASREELLDAEYLQATLAANELMATTLTQAMSDDGQEKLDSIQTTYEARKSQVESRVKEDSNIPVSYDLTDREIVRQAMKGVSGVNTRGVSTSRKRII